RLTRAAPGAGCDPRPGVEPRAQRPERAVVRGHRAPGEADSGTEELAALVEHALFDDLVRPPQHRLRDRQAEGLPLPQLPGAPGVGGRPVSRGTFFGRNVVD